jgi:hypothetical protein
MKSQRIGSATQTGQAAFPDAETVELLASESDASTADGDGDSDSALATDAALENWLSA